MKKVITLIIILAIFLSPVTVINTFQKYNISLWQGVLVSILNQGESFSLSDVKDINGDSVVDVRDLCLIVQKINNGKNRVPPSKSFNKGILFVPILRSDNNSFIRTISNQNSVVELLLNNGKDEITTFQFCMVSKGIRKENVVDKILILPLRC